MRTTVTILWQFCFVLLLSVSHSADDDLYFGGFDGVWEGSLHVLKPDLPQYSCRLSLLKGEEQKTLTLRLAVAGDKVSLSIKGKENNWIEVKPGAFRIHAHKTNAVVFATDSAPDVHDESGYGGWVETWNMTLTHKDADNLFVHWVRSINNYLEPSDAKNDKGDLKGRYMLSGFGEMKKIP